MKDVYEVTGISKQALHQYRARELRKESEINVFFEKADKIRKEHPRQGCRKMAMDMICKGWGRDKIEQLLLKGGYRVFYPVNYARTTYPQREMYFPNLIEGLELTGINQVVQTDITYYWMGGKFYYMVFLIDVYSRRIVGHAVSKTLQVEGNIKALNRMLKTRRNDSVKCLIHHSDRGSQYSCKEYLKLLYENDIKISMCVEAWENAYAERINKTIKEEYLDGWQIKSFAQLSALLTKAVDHYNNKRRHKSLAWQTPMQFEQMIKTMTPEETPKMKLYKHLENCPVNEY
jgi:hypothetical protein